MNNVMWQIVLLLFSVSLCADDKLFTDAASDDEIAMEYDPNVDEDFGLEGSESSASTSAAPGMVIADTYDIFSKRDISRREKSLSVLGGNETIASTYHFLIFPQGRFEFMHFYGHLGVPLRFPVYDNVGAKFVGNRSRGFVSGETFITPRRQDFRSFWDVQRVVRHMELYEENDPLYFRLSRINALSLGQGELVRTMSPDGLYDQDMMFLSGHGNIENGRINGFFGPILKVHMFGLSTRLTPLTNLDVAPFVRDLNFEVAYVNDFMAPNEMITDDGAYRLDSERRLVDRVDGAAQGLTLGVAGEYFAAPWMSLKPYVSMGNLWLTGLTSKGNDLNTRYGAGLHVGHDLMFHFFPGTKKSEFMFKSEGRIFSKRYWPGYFGSTYLIDRNVINEPSNKRISEEPITKSQYLAQFQDDNFRFGYMFELAYSYEKLISSSLSYENARSFMRGIQITPMRKLQFVLGFLGLDAVKFQLGYQATSPFEMKELFDFEKSRALLSLRGLIKFAPFLYFDTWAKHSFGINDMFTRMDADDDDAIWLSHQAETRSINFGFGLEFAMTF